VNGRSGLVSGYVKAEMAILPFIQFARPDLPVAEALFERSFV
jgi:hypothetical protein